MTAKNDPAAELLALLYEHPEIIDALVFDPDKVKALLKSKAARKLAGGVDTRTFLKRLVAIGTGRAIALCIKNTTFACPGGTRVPEAMCVGTSAKCKGTSKPPAWQAKQAKRF